MIEAIADTAPGKKQKVKACIPYSAGSLVNELHENQKVISEEYGENGTVMELMVGAQMYDKIRGIFCKMSKKRRIQNGKKAVAVTAYREKIKNLLQM